jgi:hypothetical protein
MNKKGELEISAGGKSLESKNEVYESRFLPKRDKMDLK